MSIASISYGSIKKASGEAKDVSRKLDKYADFLESDVLKKFDKYDGQWSTDFRSSRDKTIRKRDELREMQDQYNAYQTDLSELRNECKRVDSAVKTRISTLTASFRNSHGIKNTPIRDAINYYVNAELNKTGVGRWVNDRIEDVANATDWLHDRIKEWYRCDGGKNIITGVLEIAFGILAAAAAVAALIAASTVSAVVLACIGLVGATIGLTNAIIAGRNDFAAAGIIRDENDPARANRLSDINKFSDYLRSSFIYGDDGTIYIYSEDFEKCALGLDITKLVCDIVGIFSSISAFMKNSYKWATGDTAKLSDIHFKDMFTKENWGKFLAKIRDAARAFKISGWHGVKFALESGIGSFFENIKDVFFDFHNDAGGLDLKHIFTSLKNLVSLPKDFIKDGFKETFFKDILLPGITVFDVTTIKTGEGGQLFIDFDNVTLKKIISDIVIKGADKWGDFKNIVNKFSVRSNLNISIPKITVPKIDLPVIRNAA